MGATPNRSWGSALQDRPASPTKLGDKPHRKTAGAMSRREPYGVPTFAFVGDSTHAASFM